MFSRGIFTLLNTSAEASLLIALITGCSALAIRALWRYPLGRDEEKAGDNNTAL